VSGRSAEERPIRVLIVEDQDIVRRGLATLLELDERVEVVGEAQDGVEALRKIPRLRPEVALVDVRMPRMDGVELTERLAADHPGVAVLILTTFDDDDEYVFGGLRAGAKGYLLKNVSPEELVWAIGKVSRGEAVLGGPAASRVISELKRVGDTAAPRPGGNPLRKGGRGGGARGEGSDQRGDSPRFVHKRGYGEEPGVQDPQEAGF
jgi:DNA-binding NarL/FixJ family response regulator